MIATLEKNQGLIEGAFFLSDIIGARVFNHAEKIGKLGDVAVSGHEKLPTVTHFIVQRPFGRKPLMIPWERVRSITAREIVVDLESVDQYEGEPAESQVLLRDNVLDKKVLDMNDNEIDMVYDIKLVLCDKMLYVTDVDFSRYGLLKRLGLAPFLKLMFGSDFLKQDTLSWSYVQPLPEDIGRFRGNIKLKVMKEKLPEIHPADLADILEELNHEQSLAIFEELETRHASDTLEEIEPRVQRALISSMDKERVADLIDEMTPAQAADVLSVLPAQEADEIIDLMEHEDTEKIETLLEKQEATVTDITTKNFIRFLPDTSVSLVIAAYRKLAAEADVLDYIYVVGRDDRLHGVLSLPELLMATPETHLKEIMTTDVVSLNPDSSVDEATAEFSRYGFRALPVTNTDNVIVGVVTHRDIVNVKERFV